MHPSTYTPTTYTLEEVMAMTEKRNPYRSDPDPRSIPQDPGRKDREMEPETEDPRHGREGSDREDRTTSQPQQTPDKKK
jgi:hypothetical protein